jgi:hypothetical protein
MRHTIGITPVNLIVRRQTMLAFRAVGFRFICFTTDKLRGI